ncbi:hypothetical protein, partial [Pseudomonas viridiflava]|uniref:hypothetical protein n=1 Tax=Pseudomonas viridiflava TaxID=33069 RepID=UPI0019674577
MAQTADSVSRAHELWGLGMQPTTFCAAFESGRGASWAALPRRSVGTIIIVFLQQVLHPVSAC